MEDCEKKFSEPRAVADPRLRIVLDENAGLVWRYQDMNQVTAREILKRVALHLRLADMYKPDALMIAEHPEAGYMIDVEYHPDLPEKSICIAHHPESGAIQAAISGMTIFQACILCDSASYEFDMSNYAVVEEHGATI